MCGRFTLRASPRLVEEAIGLFSGLDDFKPRFNIAPTQSILVLHHREGEEKPRYARMRWGLVPSWAEAPLLGYRGRLLRMEGRRNEEEGHRGHRGHGHERSEAWLIQRSLRTWPLSSHTTWTR